jgi:hypothetical protein
MMVHFRQRFSEEDLNRITESIVDRGKAMVMEAVASANWPSCFQRWRQL